jgi:hypothetical protein
MPQLLKVEVLKNAWLMTCQRPDALNARKRGELASGPRFAGA